MQTVSPRRRRQGITLVIVLAFLVILTVLLLAFMSTVQTELQSARSYENGVTVKQLAATATNVVTGQIADATHSVKVIRRPGTGGSIPTGGRLAWASQPGMIRTWDDRGQGWKLFKLYSARSMVMELAAQGYSVADHLADEVPAIWPAAPALYTDLNQPELVEDSAGAIVRGGRSWRASYPILDPLALLKDKVDGLAIGAAPGYFGDPGHYNEATDPTQAPAPGTTGNPAPMPVMWIYVLKDGSLTTPTASADGGRTATWTGAAAAITPSQLNPIVGRIAFWTDDETCKLNLNTSGEPTPWDSPRALSIQDLHYARYCPAQKEYQRYPGHPFSTALSPVLFPGLPAGSLPSLPSDLDRVKKPLVDAAIYKLIPRVAAGGSFSGTVPFNSSNVAVPDSDRLFANGDELLFEPDRSSAGDDPALKALQFDASRLHRARFFLTANSRAPELNLFGQPRVSIWPVNANSSSRTAYDKLFAFCSTLGEAGKSAWPYYFQRSDSKSPSSDANLPRNRRVYQYLQELTRMDIPGYGASFSDKWPGGENDQILTEIFDYIRCINLHDSLPGAVQFAGDNNNTNDSNDGASNPGEGQVVPLTVGRTRGFGRIHTISQVALHFICSQDGRLGATDKDNSALPEGVRAIEAAILIEPFSVALGWYRLRENLTFDFRIGNMSINGQSLQFPNLVSQSLAAPALSTGWHINGRDHGGAASTRAVIAAWGGGNYPLVSQAKPRVRLKTGESMNFSGGNIDIVLRAGGVPVQAFQLHFPPGDFPAPSLVRPGDAGGTKAYRGANPPTTNGEYWWTFKSRYGATRSCPHVPGVEYYDLTRHWAAEGDDQPPGFKSGDLFRAEDVVRAIVPVDGDLRLIAAQATVSSSPPGAAQPGTFGPVSEKYWSDRSVRFLHIFSEAVGPHLLYGFANEPGPSPADGIPGAAWDDQLTASAAVQYHYARLPEIRPGAGKLFNHWGDFDNGPAQWQDGAYINKPDEGNLSATGQGAAASYPYFTYDIDTPKDTYFSPNRLAPSPGIFGSLPTGVLSRHPWQTLLFRPQAGHPGEARPKDHLIMDLFWMPVVEPYAISEPFSTAGKINLNYEIAPFSYLRRATALHGALKSEEPLVLPNAASKIYKLWDHETNDHTNNWMPDNSADADPKVRNDWALAFTGSKRPGTQGVAFDRMRRPIDPDLTLAQAEERFKKGEIFRSATEICELHLVRQGESLGDYRQNKIWPNALITGDNSRERPYANLYAKLTTRSNVFNIHLRAQVLRQSPAGNGGNWAQWREGRDQQLGEFRGATMVERYIDPSDPSLQDFAADTRTTRNSSADNAYKFRIVATKKFAP